MRFGHDKSQWISRCSYLKLSTRLHQQVNLHKWHPNAKQYDETLPFAHNPTLPIQFFLAKPHQCVERIHNGHFPRPCEGLQQKAYSLGGEEPHTGGGNLLSMTWDKLLMYHAKWPGGCIGHQITRACFSQWDYGFSIGLPWKCLNGPSLGAQNTHHRGAHHGFVTS